MLENKGFSLDPIIREVPKNEPYDAHYNTLVAVRENGEARWWRQKKERLFLVSHYGTSRSVVEGTVDASVEDFSESLRLDLSIRCRIRCQKRDSEIAAKALAGEDTPTERFVKLLQSWVEQYTSGTMSSRDFILDFFAQRPRLAEHIKKHARERLGLDVEPLVELKTRGVRNPQYVKPFELTLYLKDYARPIKVAVGGMDLFIHRDPKHEIYAHIRYDKWQQLEQKIAERIAEFAHDAITLGKLCAPGPDLSKEVEFDLNAMLAQYGRELRAAPELHPKEQLPTAPAGVDLKYALNDTRILDYPEAVKWTSDGHLQLVDLATYASSPTVDFDAWKAQIIPALIRKHIAAKTYTELFKQISSIKEAVKKDLAAEAGKIGYSVIQFVLGTNLPFDRLNDRVRVCKEDEFATSEAELKVRVSVEGLIKIEKLDRVADILNAGRAVEPEIERDIYEALKALVRSRTPEHIYLYFDRPKATSGNQDGYPSFRELAIKGISDVLLNTYGATVLSLDCKRDGTLLDRLRELEHKNRSIKVKVTKAEIEVSLTYHILRICEGWWYRFQATQPIPEILDENVARYVVQYFADKEGSDFRKELNEQWLDRLNQEGSNASLTSFVKHLFGLAIGLIEWRRELTEAEKKMLDAIATSEMAAAEVQEASIYDFKQASTVMYQNRTKERQALRERIDRINDRINALDPTDTGEAEELSDLESQKEKLYRKLEEPAAGSVMDTMKAAINRAGETLERALDPVRRVDENSRVLLAAPAVEPGKQDNTTTGSSSASAASDEVEDAEFEEDLSNE